MSPSSLAAADDRARRPPARLRLLSDERLAERIRDGDERAFDVLFERHQPGVLSFCRYLMGSRDEAQDAVQQSFLRLHGALLRERPPAELRPFLYAIARNRCRSILASRRDESAVADVPDTAGLADVVQQRADLRELVADIERLPEEQRGALVLAEMGGLSHDGIAQVLEVPEARVRTLIYQAKAHLLAEREARERSCDDVRAELATASGPALRRGPLRRHLRSCSGCRAFRGAVARQDAALGIVLPVAAAGGTLKGGLAALAGGGAAAAGGGAAAASGGGLLAGLGAVKAVAIVAAVGAGAVGTTTVVEQVRDDPPPRRQAAAPALAPVPAQAPAVATSAASRPTVAAPRRRTAAPKARRKSSSRTPGTVSPVRDDRGGASPAAPSAQRQTVRRVTKAVQKAQVRVEKAERKAARRMAKAPEREQRATGRGRSRGAAAQPATRPRPAARPRAEREPRVKPAPTVTTATPAAKP